MSVRLWSFVVVLGLIAAPAPSRVAAAEDAAEPSLIVRIRSIDSLMADAKYLTALVGEENQAKQIEGLIKSKIGAKGLEGIDTKKPLGLYGQIGAQLGSGSAVVLVPIADQQAFLDLLDRLNLKAEKGDDDIYTVTPEGSPFTVYFRFANGYAYATSPTKDALAKDSLLKPSSVLDPKDVGALSFSLRIDRIPRGLKQLALQQFDLKLADAQDQKEANESEVQHAFKVAMLKDFANKFKSVINDGEELSLRLDLERNTNDMSVELSLNGKSRSKLSADIAALGQTKSLFAGIFGGDAGLKVLLNWSLTEELRKTFAPVVDEGFQKSLDNETDETKRTLAAKLFKVLAPTWKAGQLDFAFGLRGPKDKQYTAVIGLKLKDGKAVDQALRDLVKGLPEGDQAKIEFDADKSGDIAIHRIKVTDADEKTRNVLGDQPLYAAFRPDALVLAIGPEGLPALKEALSAEPKVGPQFQFEMSLSRLARLMETVDAKKNKGAVKIAKDVFGNSQGDDVARFVIEGGDKLKIRYAFKTPLLKFVNVLGAEARGTFKEGDEPKKKPKSNDE